ncbi:MAG: hypothetical protein WCH98_22480 [Verrucomicrobiota bacterium]
MKQIISFNLIVELAIAAATIVVPLAHAQTGPKREALVARLESVALGAFETPKLFYIKSDEAGRKKTSAPLQISSESRGGINLIPAPDERITLYASPSCDAASMAQEIPVNPKLPSLLLLFYLDASGHMQSLVVPAATEHGEGQIRIINVSGVAGGIRVDSTQLAVNSGEDKILPIKLPAKTFFSYKVGWAESKNASYETGVKELFFPAPGMRMTVVLANVPSEREKPNGTRETVYSPRDYRFYDRVPENAAGTPAQTTP